jgi:hypothetical protein
MNPAVTMETISTHNGRFTQDLIRGSTVATSNTRRALRLKRLSVLSAARARHVSLSSHYFSATTTDRRIAHSTGMEI